MSKDMWKIILKSQWVGNLPVMQSCWHMYTVPFEEKAVANTVFKFTWQDKTKQSLLNENIPNFMLFNITKKVWSINTVLQSGN